MCIAIEDYLSRQKNHEILYGECISGALYINDFLNMSKQVGFADPRQVSKVEIPITVPEFKEILGEAKFYSITYRLFKLSNLEPQCEDYGQIATYKGNIVGSVSSFVLDDHHYFEKAKPVLVCGNTAAMLGESWLGKYFVIQGDRSTNFGAFPCNNTSVETVVVPSQKSCTTCCS